MSQRARLNVFQKKGIATIDKNKWTLHEYDTFKYKCSVIIYSGKQSKTKIILLQPNMTGTSTNPWINACVSLKGKSGKEYICNLILTTFYQAWTLTFRLTFCWGKWQQFDNLLSMLICCFSRKVSDLSISCHNRRYSFRQHNHCQAVSNRRVLQTTILKLICKLLLGQLRST